MPTLLSLQDVTIAFKNKAGNLNPTVHNVSLTIDHGETLALVGESGSGKSITALSLMQLLPKNAYISKNSQAFFDGQDLLSLPAMTIRQIRGNDIAMIFQDAMSALNAVLTIGEQITEVLRTHTTLTRKERRGRSLTLLHEVGIRHPEHCIRQYPHMLSGGMKQRCMIAMALAAEPKLLIVDEPTTSLDVTVQAQVIALLRKLQKQHKMSMLFISHDLSLVSQIADRIAVMQNGRIVEHNTIHHFFRQPQHTYSQQLFNAMPNPDNIAREEIPLIEYSNHLLSVQQLKVYFGKQHSLLKRQKTITKAADNISFNIQAGQTLALIGESGSGKTTVGKAILQLIDNNGGIIKFNGKRIDRQNSRAKKALRKSIQVIFQDPYSSMNPRMTILQLLEEGMAAHNIGRNREERETLTDELLRAVQLPTDFKHRYPHEFSGGQRQRICIARALSLRPKLIICDEPTSALDVSVQQQILALLKKLQEEQGIAYLLITHNFGVVAALAHHVAVMHSGHIVEYGTVKDVLITPQHDYTKTLLSAVPRIPKSDTEDRS